MSTFHYGTGRRKTATARTRLYSGTGNIVVNGRPYQEYFNRKTLQMVVNQPLKLVNMEDKLDVRVNVCGGGNAGQADGASKPRRRRHRGRGNGGGSDAPAAE